MGKGCRDHVLSNLPHTSRLRLLMTGIFSSSRYFATVRRLMDTLSFVSSCEIFSSESGLALFSFLMISVIRSNTWSLLISLSSPLVGRALLKKLFRGMTFQLKLTYLSRTALETVETWLPMSTAISFKVRGPRYWDCP